jgi:excisionase family DNA binding protein
MGLITIDQLLFSGPWGIVEARRQEIESGTYGTFERVFKEEVERTFLPIEETAALIGCSESTARKWLRECDAKFIAIGQLYRYYKPDVEKATAERIKRKAAGKTSA